jgi:hypothetical protein
MYSFTRVATCPASATLPWFTDSRVPLRRLLIDRPP